MILIHRCTCGHTDLAHRELGDCEHTCTCRKGRAEVRKRHPVETIPSYDTNGKPVAVVHGPGFALIPAGLTTCACNDCAATAARAA